MSSCWSVFETTDKGYEMKIKENEKQEGKEPIKFSTAVYGKQHWLCCHI